jgi:hypothetical protein
MGLLVGNDTLTGEYPSSDRSTRPGDHRRHRGSLDPGGAPPVLDGHQPDEFPRNDISRVGTFLFHKRWLPGFSDLSIGCHEEQRNAFTAFQGIFPYDDRVVVHGVSARDAGDGGHCS